MQQDRIEINENLISAGWFIPRWAPP